jgi:hypothetical protein
MMRAAAATLAGFKVVAAAAGLLNSESLNHMRKAASDLVQIVLSRAAEATKRRTKIILV